MVQSFIGSQKFTVQQTLERKFARYLTLPQDYHALLISLLRQALRGAQREAALAGRNPVGGAGSGADAQIKINARWGGGGRVWVGSATWCVVRNVCGRASRWRGSWSETAKN